MYTNISNLQSQRYPLMGVPAQNLVVMSGGRFIAPIAVLLGAKVLGHKSWGRSLELALIAAGTLHLLGAAFMVSMAAVNSTAQSAE